MEKSVWVVVRFCRVLLGCTESPLVKGTLEIKGFCPARGLRYPGLFSKSGDLSPAFMSSRCRQLEMSRSCLETVLASSIC